MEPDEKKFAVEHALLQERQAKMGERLDALEKGHETLEQKVRTGQVTLIILAGVGGFLGWLATILDKIKSWFH